MERTYAVQPNRSGEDSRRSPSAWARWSEPLKNLDSIRTGWMQTSLLQVLGVKRWPHLSARSGGAFLRAVLRTAWPPHKWGTLCVWDLRRLQARSGDLSSDGNFCAGWLWWREEQKNEWCELEGEEKSLVTYNTNVFNLLKIVFYLKTRCKNLDLTYLHK